jgi:(S)-2-hydroxyglutarate dehydrogenase
VARESGVDILVVGAGVLGVTLACWLSVAYDCSVALADLGERAGTHTTSRNTGIIHRPFYLEPRRKRVFARTSLVSLPLWRNLAHAGGLPWKPLGTFNVALEEGEVKTIERYRSWGVENGMGEDELELLDGRGVRSIEPEISCRAALLSRTDVSVNFGAFTSYLWRLLLAKGLRFLGGHRMISFRKTRGSVVAEFSTAGGRREVNCAYLINAAGGGALEIAHSAGFARNYAALNFRGEYWVVDEPFASRVTSNVYRPPRFPQYPFLDPHFVVRADGSRQIGPNAVVVPGPYVYTGVGLSRLASFFDRPIGPKVGLAANPDFLSLVAGEWMSSLSKRAMCARVRKFVPALDAGMLGRRAVFGVRSSVIDESGFVPEALLFRDGESAHVVNYNSPGATGAPAYSAMIVAQLRAEGLLDRFRKARASEFIPGWDLKVVEEQLR